MSGRGCNVVRVEVGEGPEGEETNKKESDCLGGLEEPVRGVVVIGSQSTSCQAYLTVGATPPKTNSPLVTRLSSSLSSLHDVHLIATTNVDRILVPQCCLEELRYRYVSSL